MTRRYEERIRERNPRELTYQFELGGRKLLGIFGVVAVVCGLFFGLGYTIGRHKVPATFTLGGSVNATNTAKLAAGTPLAPPAPVPSASVAPPTTNDLTAAEASQTSQPLQPTAAATPTPAAATAANPPPATIMPVAATSPAVRANSTAPAGTGYRVQVFAGKGEGHAVALAAALKAQGFPVVFVRPGSGQDLFRVQVGPYSTRAAAENAQRNLLVNGYRSILKP